jgi:probable HAF family extracellular repeat protein
MVDLNNAAAAPGWTLEQATAINDNGQIVGYGVNASGQRDAFLLTPSPEPPTLCLLITCACSLLASHLCRRVPSGQMLDKSSATYHNERHWAGISP